MRTKYTTCALACQVWALPQAPEAEAQAAQAKVLRFDRSKHAIGHGGVSDALDPFQADKVERQALALLSAVGKYAYCRPGGIPIRWPRSQLFHTVRFGLRPSRLAE